MKIVCLVLALLFPCAAPAARAQEARPDDPAAADARRGAELYRSGDMKGAAKAFRAALKRRKDDAALWVNLAQALVHRGELAEARKALDTALMLAPDQAATHASLAYLHLVSGKPREAEAAAQRALDLDARSIDAHYVLGLLRLREGAWLKAVEAADRIIKLDERAAVAYSLKAEALLGLYERGNAVLGEERRGAYDFNEETVREARAEQPRRLREAAENFEQYLRLRPDAPNAAEVREQIEALRLYAQSDRPEAATKVYQPHELTTKAVIVSKPEPGYTEEARRAGVSGMVRLRAVLGFDGRVRNISVVRRLEFGLTEAAVAAARKIKFKPATVGGLPVSQWVTLEYNFNFY